MWIYVNGSNCSLDTICWKSKKKDHSYQFLFKTVMNHDCFIQNYMTAINVTLLMDYLSERGNSHLQKAITLKLKSLSCDKWQDSVELGKAFTCQLSCLSHRFPPVVGFICRLKQPAGSLDTALNLCQLQSRHKSLWPLFQVIGTRDKSNRWSITSERLIHRELFFSGQ